MKRLICTLSMLCVVLLTFGQADSAVIRIKQYLTNIHSFNQAYPQEKVYLHLDNHSYFIGDTIWFKAYVTNASTLKLTDISQILYVELLNEKGVEMETLKLRLEKGQCHGAFALKDKYYTGYYELRAYTRNMINFGNESFTRFDFMEKEAERQFSQLSEKEARQDLVPPINHCLFSRTVPVFSRPDTAGIYKREFEYYPIHTRLAIPDETDPKMRKDNLEVKFYPEGGYLVDGLTSVIAIEASDQWGREKKVTGEIVCDDKTIVSFLTGHRGRARIEFTPEQGKRYEARVTYKEKTYRYRLPESLKTGYVLRITPTAGYTGYMVTIQSSTEQPQLLGWSLQCRGTLTAFDTLSVGNKQITRLPIDTKSLRPGVNQFTLFDAQGQILADRLFFVQPPTNLPTILAELPTDSLRPFEKIEINLQARTAWGGGTQSHLSVSITDADEQSPTFDTRDIRTELLLTSDLKGFIKDIGSYFAHTSPNAMHTDIDLLMLTQGWRRYEWVTMAQGKAPEPYYTPEKGYIVDGYVADQLIEERLKWNALEYKRIENPWVAIELKSEQVEFRDTVQANSRGEFSFDIPRHFMDDAGLSIELWKPDGLGKKGKKGKYRYVFPSLYSAFSPAPTPYCYYESHSPEDDYELQVLENVNYAMEGLIDEVTIKKRNKQSYEIHYDRPDIVIDFVKEYNTIIDRGLHALTDPPPLKGFYDPTATYTLNRSRIPDTLKYIFIEGDNATKDSLTYAWYSKYRTQETDPERLSGGISNGEYLIPDQGGRSYLNFYQLPKEIRIYSNLVSRERYPVKQDLSTDHRRKLWAHTTYYAKEESPTTPPYDMRDGTRHTTFKGYSRVAEYYHRDYSETLLPDSADYRRTLYWDPDIETNHQGRATIQFYNNARTKRIMIHAEGITSWGDLITLKEEQGIIPPLHDEM